jgi:hypothetical protein
MTDNKTIDFIEAQIKQFIESRRPTHEIRDQVDISYTLTNNSLEIFSIRPRWDNLQEKIHEPIAKARFIKSRKLWKLYWMRASGKWVPYEPNAEVKSTEEMLTIIGEDQYGCFWG